MLDSVDARCRFRLIVPSLVYNKNLKSDLVARHRKSNFFFIINLRQWETREESGILGGGEQIVKTKKNRRKNLKNLEKKIGKKKLTGNCLKSIGNLTYPNRLG